MVKCDKCGLEVDDNFSNCPNCGNDLTNSNEDSNMLQETGVCNNCGAELKENNAFCPRCGTKVENDDGKLKCNNCGSDLPENTLFCPVCGTKVENIIREPEKRTCPNCGSEVDEGAVFCDECGSNVTTGEKPKQEVIVNNNETFMDKLDPHVLVKPSVIALFISVILSLIGLAIGFSWFSFIIAIILSVGFFAGLIDNEANASLFGLIVGLILGLLETPLVEFMYGAFVAGVYDVFIGGHLFIIVVLGVITAYVSNVFFKDNIQSFVNNFR